jgi:hypothetical protein
MLLLLLLRNVSSVQLIVPHVILQLLVLLAIHSMLLNNLQIPLVGVTLDSIILMATVFYLVLKEPMLISLPENVSLALKHAPLVQQEPLLLAMNVNQDTDLLIIHVFVYLDTLSLVPLPVSKFVPLKCTLITLN